MRRRIRHQHHHLRTMSPPIQARQRLIHGRRRCFRPIATSRRRQASEFFFELGDRGGEGQGLGDVRAVLRRVVAVGDDLRGEDKSRTDNYLSLPG